MLRRPDLVPGETLFVRKEFIWDGKKHKMNKEFPYQQLGVPQRKVFTLYSTGFLVRKDGNPRALKKITQRKPNEFPQLEKDSFDSSFFHIRHLGGGWNDLLYKGKIISEKKIRRTDAEKMIKKIQKERKLP